MCNDSGPFLVSNGYSSSSLASQVSTEQVVEGYASTMNAAFPMSVQLVVTGLAPIMRVKRCDPGPDKARERVRHGRHKGSQFSSRRHCS